MDFVSYHCPRINVITNFNFVNMRETKPTTHKLCINKPLDFGYRRKSTLTKEKKTFKSTVIVFQHWGQLVQEYPKDQCQDHSCFYCISMTLLVILQIMSASLLTIRHSILLQTKTLLEQTTLLQLILVSQIDGQYNGQLILIPRKHLI